MIISLFLRPALDTGQAQGDLIKRILQNETEISCAAHYDDTRLDCGDHM